jgi:hypothetical protein
MAINGGQIMIDVFAIEVQAVDEDNNLLFTLKMEDEYCCTMSITKPLLLSNGNLEEVMEAVSRAVKMLKLQ